MILKSLVKYFAHYLLSVVGVGGVFRLFQWIRSQINQFSINWMPLSYGSWDFVNYFGPVFIYKEIDLSVHILFEVDLGLRRCFF